MAVLGCAWRCQTAPGNWIVNRFYGIGSIIAGSTTSRLKAPPSPRARNWPAICLCAQCLCSQLSVVYVEDVTNPQFGLPTASIIHSTRQHVGHITTAAHSKSICRSCGSGATPLLANATLGATARDVHFPAQCSNPPGSAAAHRALTLTRTGLRSSGSANLRPDFMFVRLAQRMMCGSLPRSVIGHKHNEAV